MKTRTKRIAGLAAAGVLVGGGLAGAFAATSGPDDQAGDLASALSKRTGGQVTAARPGTSSSRAIPTGTPGSRGRMTSLHIATGATRARPGLRAARPAP